MACKNWIEYNNNPKQRNVDDCVIRAITKCFNSTWCETYRILGEVACQTGYIYNDRRNYDSYIYKMGYVKCVVDGLELTVNQIANIQQQMGGSRSWLVRVNGHLTTAVDGMFYDTWDCGRRKATSIFVKEYEKDRVKEVITKEVGKKGMRVKWN